MDCVILEDVALLHLWLFFWLLLAAVLNSLDFRLIRIAAFCPQGPTEKPVPPIIHEYPGFS
jgi:hypothetical protein